MGLFCLIAKGKKHSCAFGGALIAHGALISPISTFYYQCFSHFAPFHLKQITWSQKIPQEAGINVSIIYKQSQQTRKGESPTAVQKAIEDLCVFFCLYLQTVVTVNAAPQQPVQQINSILTLM